MKNSEIPSKFVDYLTEAAGARIASIVLEAVMSGTPEVSIRINPMKVSDPAALDLPLDGNIPWCKDGFYLSKRPNFTLDPALHAGAYYVQEPSSMSLSVLEPIFRDLRPREILDLCAAPGGKSTHIISMAMRYSSVPSSSPSTAHSSAVISPATRGNNSNSSNDSLIVNHLQDTYLPHITCNEVIKSRAAILNENVTKWGVNSVSVTSKDPENFAREGSTFDLILVDAPCSGEGMFRKDPDAISEWSEENVKLCAARQRRILSDIWDALVPGGILIYSTCTFNKYENDENLHWLKSELGALPYSFSSTEELEKNGVIVTPEGGFQFFPGVVRGEGFYFAVVRKPFEENGEFTVFPERESQSKNKNEERRGEKSKSDEIRKGEKLNKSVANLRPDKISNSDYEKNFRDEKNIKTEKSSKSGKSWSNDKINRPAKNDKISDTPEHQFALSVNYDFEQEWPSVELSKEDAITYLSRNTINLDPNAPLGYLRVTYKGLGLGFVKNLGSRANNLYPMNWRIRKY